MLKIASNNWYFKFICQQRREKIYIKREIFSRLSLLWFGASSTLRFLYAFLIKRSGTSNMLNMRFMLFIKITQSVHDCDEWMEKKERNEIVRGGRFEGFGMVGNRENWNCEKGNSWNWGGTRDAGKNLGTRAIAKFEDPLLTLVLSSGSTSGLSTPSPPMST